MTNLSTIETGFFLCDGGAIFGLLPKMIWQKYYHADSKNLCTLAMRVAVYRENEKIFLFDAGVGEKNSLIPSGYSFIKQQSLAKGLENLGISVNQITDIVLSHLHFDHCGGVSEIIAGQICATFPNARYHISRKQWIHHHAPPLMEASGYIQQNTNFIEENRINWIEDDQWISDTIECRLVDGHTPGQIVSIIHEMKVTWFFVADLLPVALSCRESCISAFDIDPAASYMNKERILQEACEFKNNRILFYHDENIKFAHIEQKGKRYHLSNLNQIEDSSC